MRYKFGQMLIATKEAVRATVLKEEQKAVCIRHDNDFFIRVVVKGRVNSSTYSTKFWEADPNG